MDVAWWVRLYYKIDLSKYRQLYTDTTQFNQVIWDVQNIILENIDTRISGLWVSDYESRIQTLEDGQYVVIDLWGINDLQQAKEIIWKTVELEFKVPYTWGQEDVTIRRQLLAESVLKEAVNWSKTFSTLAIENAGQEVAYQVYNDVTIDELPQIYQNNAEIFENPTEWVYPTLLGWTYRDSADTWWIQETMTGWVIANITAIGPQSEWSQPDNAPWTGQLDSADQADGTNQADSADNAGETDTTDTTDTTGEQVYTIQELFVTDTPQRIAAKDPVSEEILNGAFFNYASLWQTQTAQTAVLVHFNERGKQIFCNLTAEIIGEQMAIFVGGELVTAPVIQDRICQWTAQITGQFTSEEARTMIDNLNEGALPAPLVLAHEEKVSATLWARALRGSIIAWLVWLWLVFVYMIAAYGRRKGLVWVITLISFLIVLFACIKLVWFALSLSGIAAILLSIWMWVDANIIIYERVDEEEGEWKSTYEAVTDGYERSRSAIRDGNITTWFIALLLLVIWTNVFKWFGTMMVVNILITLLVLTPMTKYLLLRILWSRK